MADEKMKREIEECMKALEETEKNETTSELRQIFELPNPQDILPAVKKAEVKKSKTKPEKIETPVTRNEDSVVLKQVTPVDERSEVAEKDFNYTRNTLYQVIEIGVTSLSQLSELAERSQHPRCHEVVATLIKNISESTKELLALHKTMKDLTKENLPAEKNITNNNLILTTDELLRKLKGS